MSDSKDLIQAIHHLELNLKERIHMQTTALEVNNERLDNLRIAVDRHRELLYGHDDGNRSGLIADMRELQKADKERKWTMRTVTASFLGLAGKFVWDIFQSL